MGREDYVSEDLLQQLIAQYPDLIPGAQINSVRTYGSVEIQFQYLRTRPAFKSVGKRQEIRARLNSIEGAHIPENKLDIRPSLPLSALTNPESLNKFLDTFEWVVSEARAFHEAAQALQSGLLSFC